MEDKWTYSYNDELQAFVKTINSRINRLTGLAQNKFTNRDIPFLVALSANSAQKLVRRPKFHIGVFLCKSKADIPFRRGYKQTFPNEVFEIYDIPTVDPPTYNLIDTNQEPVTGKF